MKFRRNLIVCVAILTVNCIANQSYAQSRSGQTGGGTGLGSGGIGSIGGGSTGGIGSSGGTIGGGSQTGGTTGAAGETGQSISQLPDRTLQDVGTGTTGAAGGLGRLGGLGGFGGGGLGGLSAFGLNPFGTGAGSSEAKPTVRTRLRSRVAVPVRSPGVAQSLAQTRVSKSLATPRFQGVGVSVSDAGATITGTARSAEDRRMAELLLRLEPGINQVNNQIVVAP